MSSKKEQKEKEEMNKTEISPKLEKELDIETVPKKDFDELKAKYAETVALMQRIQADFENNKKRETLEKQNATLYAKIKMLNNLLVIIDTFEVALKSNSNPEQFRKGVEMIYAQLQNYIKNENVIPIDTCKKYFDPHLHEILLQETKDEDASKDGLILEELQKGYMIGNCVLRTSKVKTIRVKNADNEKHNQGTCN